MRLLHTYRASGADLPFGDPLPAHGVAMEGYFWRLTERHTGRVVIALLGVNRATDGVWGTVGLAAWPGSHLWTVAAPYAWADPHRLGASAPGYFHGDSDGVHVEVGGAELDLRLSDQVEWPRRRFGGSSLFQSVPALNQYWHPHVLGGRGVGTLRLPSGETWELDGQVYAEKNWGRGGFPEAWWWGQAQGFAEPEACVAFAGGRVSAGPLHTEVTAVVVRLPDGQVLRLGNPGTSPVRAEVTDETWQLTGANVTGWRVEIAGRAPLADAHVLPVPLPAERRNIPGALEHLAGELSVTVRREGVEVWGGTSYLAGLEHGGLDRAAAEMQRRGAPAGAEGIPPG